MQREEAQIRAANKVTWIGALVNGLLGILKVVVGLFSHSAALIADGIHSLSDLFTDLLVIIILKISGKGPDEDHPWGHGHFETVGTAILGSILIAVAGAMAYDSVLKLAHLESQPIPEWPALAVAIFSVASKEWIYRYTLRVGKEVESELLIANAWHSRTDALSSIVVFVGVAGTMAGINWLDSAAAIAVAIMVAKIGWDLSWSSFQQLVDTALPSELIEKYKAQVISVEGIVSVHSFKTRAMGSKNLLELHIQVSSHISASEGHYIGDLACKQLLQNSEIGHIIYHIDTFDDENLESDKNPPVLPSRQEIIPLIDQCLARIDSNIAPYRVYLHYTKEQIDIELLFKAPLHDPLDPLKIDQQQLLDQIQAAFTESALGSEWVGEIYLATGILR
ncbi:cation diffusion facilitator family transporter [uncultured Neptuniibacter sp.]|uniref:cation diffusion facilitator family transporter n=1 Tax=uncultured Neptuniibacter sp. TaxID=502143 RepID=UPI0026259A95|nr:cation diffusion facilitator family transporter [uncultured Neptuniibacter sp.]